ncbi:MAG: phage tail protein [Candidatus Omnitrophota bacterium]
MADPFIGEIRLFPFNYAPIGWAFCNGQLMSVPQNTALFAVIGNQYGGDGQTNFALPNFQGRIPMHWGTGTGLTPRTIAQTLGVTTVTLTDTQLPAHTHTLNAQSGNADQLSPSGNFLANVGNGGTRPVKIMNYTTAPVPPATSTALSPQSISAVGSGQAHTNMQPYLTLNFCMAIEGIFPVRS